jgi:hypothetical protein
MLDVLQLCGQYPVRGRNNYRCFAHSPDKRPSAGLTKDGTKFHCFSCGWTGSIFDVVQHFEQCDIKEAMKILDAKLHLGVYQELSESEKRKIARQIKEKEKELQEKLWWQEYEKVVLADVVKELRFWEQVQKLTHITRGEYRRGEWEFADLFFESLKRQDWLNWLYDAVCGFDHPECEYDYIYPADKKELLEMIKSGAISIEP